MTADDLTDLAPAEGETGAPRPNGAKRDLLQSVQRACAILRLLAQERRPMTAREVSESLGLNLGTCYHLLNTLEHEEFLARDRERHFALGSSIGELHDAFESQLAPDEHLVESLDDLNRRTGETSYLGVWRGEDVVSVAVREGRRGVRVRASHLGYARHAYARALGRALLAFRDAAFIDAYLAHEELAPLTPATTVEPDALRRILADVRTLGVAIEREELSAGVCCVAAPVFEPGQGAVAAFSVSVPKARFDAEGTQIVEDVRAVARLASEQLARMRSADG